MTPFDRNQDRLELILELVDHLQRRLADMTFGTFADDGDERDLTAFRLSVIGENTNKLSDDLKARHPHLPWRQMYAFRNLVAHEYRVVVPERVWVAATSLQPVREMCVTELAAYPPDAYSLDRP